MLLGANTVSLSRQAPKWMIKLFYIVAWSLPCYLQAANIKPRCWENHYCYFTTIEGKRFGLLAQFTLLVKSYTKLSIYFKSILDQLGGVLKFDIFQTPPDLRIDDSLGFVPQIVFRSPGSNEFPAPQLTFPSPSRGRSLESGLKSPNG